ncbi:MAG TPA: molybdopterin biosynthesis protein [Desulfotomaculum sp.]|nr:molybdopterin biosynthesis protein [Desulfotomaculum sp.]
MGRNIYLEDIPLEKAIEKYLQELDKIGALKPAPPELIPAENSLHRITAQPVYAKGSSPHYHSAAMDGYAVMAASTFGAKETSPLQLRSEIDAIPVDTGDPLPAGCDAVIMIEDIHPVKEGIIEIIQPAYPWQHVRVVGEDIVATEMIIPSNHRVRPIDIAGLLAGGVNEIAVRPKPYAAIIPTGDEIIEPCAEPAPGKIIDFNSRVFAAMIEEWGGLAQRRKIIKDDPQMLQQALAAAVKTADLVLINAGSSAGREDFTSEVISRMGKVVAHGVAIRPGKPVILGIIENKPVIGIPGYPVSAYLCAELFVKRIIYYKQALIPPPREKINALMSRKLYSSLGVEEFVRVKLGRVGDHVIATPVTRGAGVVMSLIRADGVVRVPRFSEGIAKGEITEVELLRSDHEVQETTVIIGSHDNTLDILANYMRLFFPEASVSSAHVGSLAGLTALRKNEAHCAGIHLLDEETGEYNVSYLKRYLPKKEVILVNLVYRQQGLIVKKGNPKNISGLEDLTRQDITFVNRQNGAGTRVLLDYSLKQKEISPDKIKGYDREEYTHMAVAAAVAAGEADCALGIQAAANALNLDFISLGEERYDLCIPEEHWETRYIKRLLSVIESPDFKKEVSSLAGYDLRDCGKIMWKSSE